MQLPATLPTDTPMRSRWAPIWRRSPRSWPCLNSGYRRRATPLNTGRRVVPQPDYPARAAGCQTGSPPYSPADSPTRRLLRAGFRVGARTRADHRPIRRHRNRGIHLGATARPSNGACLGVGGAGDHRASGVRGMDDREQPERPALRQASSRKSPHFGTKMGAGT